MDRSRFLFPLVLLAWFSVFAQQVGVTGTVKTFSGTPVKGLTVVLESMGSPTIQAITDSLGNYVMSVNTGTYSQLRVRNTGSTVPGVPKTLEYTAETAVTITQATVKDITLPKFVRISGKTLSPSSVRVAGVQLTAKKWTGAEAPPWDNCTSDTGGNYELYQDSGSVKIWITPTAPYVASEAVYSFSGDTSINLTLTMPIILSGTVKNFNGDTVSGITVSVKAIGSVLQVDSATNAFGRYSIPLNPGTYTLRLRTTGLAPVKNAPKEFEGLVTDTITLTADTVKNLTLPFLPAVTCSLVTASGTAVPKATVNSNGPGNSPPRDTRTTDSLGKCVVYVAPGANEFRIIPDTASALTETFLQNVINKDTLLVITVPTGAKVSGKVCRADSSAVAGISVAFERNGDQKMFSTGAQGDFSGRLENGIYRMRVRNMNTLISGIPSTLEYTAIDSLTIADSAKLDIVLPLFPVISGTIKNASGSAVSGAQIVAKHWFGGAESPPWDHTTSGANGSYSISVGLGVTKIWVSPPPDQMTLGAFDFIENFDRSRTKDIFIPDQARGITRIQPSVITTGNSGTVTINGINANFTSGTVTLVCGAGITASDIRVISDITIKATLSIDSTAATGTRDVLAAVGNQNLVGAGLLTITAPASAAVVLDASNKTTQEVKISDGTGTELLIPKGTTVQFPVGAEKVISYEAPFIKSTDTVTADNTALTNIQRTLSPSGLVFLDTVTMTTQYKDQDVKGIDELSLKPFYFTDTAGAAGTIGDSITVLDRDTSKNLITISLGHFSMFRLTAKAQGAMRTLPRSKNTVMPLSMVLIQNSVRHAFRIVFSTGANGTRQIRLSIIDARGSVIRLLVDGVLGNGTFTSLWDGQNNSGSFVASGMYIVRLEAGKTSIEQRVVFIR